jgi:uncharacterized protein
LSEAADAGVPFRLDADGILLHVRLTPKGGRDALEGVFSGDDGKAVLLARVRAVPEDGAANAALIALVAKQLGIRKSAIELVAGGKARNKTLHIAVEGAEMVARLAAICTS